MEVYKKIIALLFLTAAFASNAQVATDSELYKVLAKKDSILFNAAFNTCDIGTLEEIFTKDFEFYHDKGGATEGRDSFLDPMKVNCANRGSKALQPSKRILVPGSLEVYPLYKNGELYGAIQHGVHSFEFLNDKKEYQKGDVAKFTHVWIKEDGRWKVKRELSYDHQLQKT